MVPRLDLTLAGEALQKRTVDAVEGHPVKVALDGPGVAGGKEMDGVASAGGETGGGVELVGVVVGGVGPDVGVGTAAAGDGVVEPVEPAVVAWADGLAVPGTREPAGVRRVRARCGMLTSPGSRRAPCPGS
jgi:hypothetical protein